MEGPGSLQQTNGKMSIVRAVENKELAHILRDDARDNKLLVLEFVEPQNYICQYVRPLLLGIANRFANKAEFYELDCNKFEQFARRLKVEAVPVFVLMRKRKVVDVVTGADTEGLERCIQQHISGERSPISEESTAVLEMPGFPRITVRRSQYQPPVTRREQQQQQSVVYCQPVVQYNDHEQLPIEQLPYGHSSGPPTPKRTVIPKSPRPRFLSNWINSNQPKT
ncbi:hypothetical protein ACP4OV_014746 [Aristida adscensionis]